VSDGPTLTFEHRLVNLFLNYFITFALFLADKVKCRFLILGAGSTNRVVSKATAPADLYNIFTGLNHLIILVGVFGTVMEFEAQA
jgi:hypothetical protein